MIITNAHLGTFGVRRRTIEREIHVGPLSFRFITVVILALVALFYLIQSSQGASSSYRAYELQQEKQRLEEEQKRLELESIRLRSLNEIKKNTPLMEPVRQINHLPTSGTVSVNP